MDYEQKYKAALEWMRDVYPTLTGASKEDAEHFFPELAESEDERVNEEIRNFLIDMECKREWIAYLEKQKEQKPKQSEMEKEYVRTLHSLISDFLRGKQEIDIEYYQKIWDWLDNRYIEQKPTEKQDYSGLTDFERAIHRGFLCAGVESVPVEIIKETAQDCLAHIEQKPAEWSKEDERIRLACIATINDVIDYKRDRWEDYNPGRPYRPITKYDEQIDWLKSLRPQN